MRNLSFIGSRSCIYLREGCVTRIQLGGGGGDLIFSRIF